MAPERKRSAKDPRNAGNSKEALVTCPHCEYLFDVGRLFWEPRFADVALFSPQCRNTFDKAESPRVVG